jgi:SHS2 domain-containing protein
MPNKEKRFKFREHTADFYIESYGKTLEEAFQNAAIGLGKFIITSDNVRSSIKKSIKIDAEDKESLLFEFLNKFIYFQDAESMIFHNIKVDKIEHKNNKWTLTATASGEEFNPDKHTEGKAVKAVTYHFMEIEEKKGKYRVKVLIDI